QAEDGIRDLIVTGVQTCALPISSPMNLPLKGKHRHMAFALLPQMLFILPALGVWFGGGYWLLMPIVFLLVIVPLLDLVTGWQDRSEERRVGKECGGRWSRWQ